MTLPPHSPIKYGAPDTSNNGTPPPVPSEAKNVGHFLPSYDDKLWMFHRRWEPSKNVKIKATLMIVHGTVDHSGVYDEIAQDLAKEGVAVIAQDMRGWGLSDGESMYFPDIEVFCKDALHLSETIHALPEYQNVTASKRFLLGKSIGGLITAFCSGRYFRDHWQGGLIGLSGAYQLGSGFAPSIVTKLVLKGVGMVAPKLALKPLFDEKLIVADETALQNWRDDPLCCKDNLRTGYILEIIRASQEMADEPLQIETPLLVLIGDDDKVVAGQDLLLAQCHHQDKVLKKFPAGRHNLLQEPALKEEVQNEIIRWIMDHTE